MQTHTNRVAQEAQGAGESLAEWFAAYDADAYFRAQAQWNFSLEEIAEARNLMDATVGAPVPADFWGQVDHQLDRIQAVRPSSFVRLREILTDPAYTHLGVYRDQPMSADAAFFAGSGGDRSLRSALGDDWRTTWAEAGYYYVLKHTRTGEVITYVEGDVFAGDQHLED